MSSLKLAWLNGAWLPPSLMVNVFAISMPSNIGQDRMFKSAVCSFSKWVWLIHLAGCDSGAAFGPAPRLAFAEGALVAMSLSGADTQMQQASEADARGSSECMGCCACACYVISLRAASLPCGQRPPKIQLFTLHYETNCHLKCQGTPEGGWRPNGGPSGARIGPQIWGPYLNPIEPQQPSHQGPNWDQFRVGAQVLLLLATNELWGIMLYELQNRQMLLVMSSAHKNHAMIWCRFNCWSGPTWSDFNMVDSAWLAPTWILMKTMM